jgi:hypothetical protein
MDLNRAMRRSEIRLLCPCRTLDGVPLELELLDLSERGCRGRSVGIVLHFGQALRLFPEGCDAFTATVRRSDGEMVGIEFDGPLPTPVFERMRCYAPDPEDRIEPDVGTTPPEPTTSPVSASQAEEADAARPQPYGSLLTHGPAKRQSKKLALG